MEPSRAPLHVSNPLRPFEKVAVKKQCPKCGSLFVTKKECEACGFQFWVNLLGDPFGARSFFSLRDDFIHQYKWTYRMAFFTWAQYSKEIQKYKRMLIKRFEILCGYFFDEHDKDKERRRLFLFEANEIIGEYALVGGKLSDLWLILEKGEHHPLFQNLAQTISQVQNEKSAHSIKESVELSLQKRFMGTFTYLFLLKLATGSVAVILAAYLYMKAFLLP